MNFRATFSESSQGMQADFDNAQVIGGNGGSIKVDSELSETSRNPVENRVVTKRIIEIDTTVGNVNALLETI